MPSPTVDAELVAYVARLARLQLQPDEARRMERDLREILSYVSELQSVDVDGVAPLVHPHAGDAPWRPDVVRAPLGQMEALRNAPEAEAGCFVVPKPTFQKVMG
jgi:aspartyl-tRNA(Asn)/glutamyl-tRNA(Gln) amidotransferase subunit C